MNILEIVIVAAASVIGLVASFFADSSPRPRIYRFLKPLPIFLLIFIIGFSLFKGQTTAGGVASLLPLLVLIGLCAGVTGDILLLNTERYFIFGLAAFLIGHLFYVASFFQVPFSFVRALPMIVIIGIIAIIYGTALFRKVKDKRVCLPIAFYIVAICAMTISAFNFDLSSGLQIWPLFTVGALLFCLSDSVLAWMIFVERFKHCELLVMTTYYAAQILLTVKTLLLLV